MTKPTKELTKLDIISDIHKDLAKEISELNALITNRVTSSDEELIGLIGQHLIEAGGKRIRPLLTILSSKMFGYKSDSAISLAAAVELIHTATLLHDDVVDQSTMRRFKPTANIVWGDKASILVGDFLFNQSFQLMVASDSVEALKVLSKVLGLIAEGEVFQLVIFQQHRMIDLAEYEKIIAAKTGVLFSVACEVGAIIENQSADVRIIMKDFGMNLGKIFQISDDLLDYCGEGSTRGKNIGDDFAEGKVTLPLILLYNKLDTENREKLIKMIKVDSRSLNEFTWVQDLLRDNKIKEEMIEHMNLLKSDTIKLLENIPVKNQYHDYFLKLIDFAVNRSF